VLGIAAAAAAVLFPGCNESCCLSDSRAIFTRGVEGKMFTEHGTKHLCLGDDQAHKKTEEYICLVVTT
jgi:hypothetical protein